MTLLGQGARPPQRAVAEAQAGVDLASLMQVVLVVVLTVLALLLLAVFAHRLGAGLVDARRQRLVQRVRPLLLDVLADESADPESLAALSSLPDGQWRVLEPTVVAMLGKVRGGARASLVELLEQRGTLERAERRTRARSRLARCQAAEMLGAARQPRSLPALVRLLHDRDGEVRQVAARALGRVGAADATEPLLAAVTGPRALPARDVASALVLLEPAATPAVADAVARARDRQVRAVGAEVLGLRGAVEATSLLVAMLAGDESLEARIRAARALGRIGARAATPPLVAALRAESPELRAVAARALGQLGSAEAVDALVERLYDSWHRVASNAGEALVALGPPGVTALTAVAASGGPPAAAYAEQSLAMQGVAERTFTRAGG